MSTSDIIVCGMFLMLGILLAVGVWICLQNRLTPIAPRWRHIVLILGAIAAGEALLVTLAVIAYRLILPVFPGELYWLLPLLRVTAVLALLSLPLVLLGKGPGRGLLIPGSLAIAFFWFMLGITGLFSKEEPIRGNPMILRLPPRK